MLPQIDTLKVILDKQVKRYIKSDEHQKMYDLAFWLWDFFHREQKRDTWEDYFTHPIQTTLLLIDLFWKDISITDIIVSLLHDALEDTLLEYETIKNLFWLYTADCIRQMTKWNKLDYLKGEEKRRLDELSTESETDRIEINEILHQSRLRRDHEYYENFNHWNIQSLRVKICDRLHNLVTMPVGDTERIKKNIRTTRLYFLPSSDKIPRKILDKIEEVIKTLE